MSREVARYTYTAGSRPEGCIVYDADSKFHSHHDTDPARGQHNAFDLVRLHRFGHLDKDTPPKTVITERPSFKAMCEFAAELPEIRAARAGAEFEDQGALPETPAANTGIAARFTPKHPGEFASGPQQEWLVRDVLPRAALTVIFGESGSGKTFWVLDIVSALTRGVPWDGRRTKQCKVTYICAEGARGFKKRLRAYVEGHAVSIDTLPWVIADCPNFLSIEHPAAVIQGMKATGQTDVVVVDVLAAVMPGGNENSSEAMGAVIDYCKLIHRQTGALVILIHHSGKDQARGARGWSGLRAAADAEIEITRTGDQRAWSTSKMKDSTDDVTGAFKLKVVPLGLDADGEEVSSCVVEHVEAPKQDARGKLKPSGRHQVAMFDALKTMAPSGTVHYEDLIDSYIAKMPKGVKDRRRQDGKRALEELIAKRLAHMHDEDRVSLTSLVATGDAGWLE